jgi:hypothetical protein
MRRVAWWGLGIAAVLAILAPACSSKDVAAGIAAEQACSLNSDCAAGLVCALGRCRDQCANASDCGSGGSCVTDGTHAVCQSAADKDTPCERPSDCPAPLACASDYRCRNLCQTATDCNVLGITDRVCARDANNVDYCADPGEALDGILVTLPPAGAPDSGVTEPSTGTSGVALDAGVIASFVGPAGGTLGIGALSVTVPPGALDHDLVLSITPIVAPIPGSIGPAYDIGPSGTQFNQPITIAFTYTNGELGGLSPGQLAVGTVVGNAWQPVSAPVVDPYAQTIAGTTTHLSPYALVATGSSDGGSDATGGDSSASTTSPEPTESMSVVLFGADGGATYSFACPGYYTEESDDFMAANGISMSCPWASSNPDLDLELDLTGYLPSVGPPVGTYDFSSQPDAGFGYGISLHVYSQMEVAVGSDQPTRLYDSPVGAGGSGTLTISKTGLYLCSDDLLDAAPADSGTGGCGIQAGPVYLIQLDHVTLASSQDYSAGLYPPEATITATLYWLNSQ